MATDRMALVDVLRKGQDPEADLLQEGVRWLIQALMEAEVSAQIDITSAAFEKPN